MLTCLFLKLTNAHAEENTTQVKMLTMEQIPYGYFTGENKPTGVLFDIANAILKTSGVSSSNTIVPVSRLVMRMTNTPNSCTIAIDSDSLSTENKIEKLGFTLSAGIIPKKGLEIKTYDDLYDLRIAIPLGMRFDNQLYDDPSLDIIRPPKYSNAIRMLMSDRVDAVAGAIFILRYLASLQGLQPEMLGKPLIFIEPDVYLICAHDLDDNTKAKLKAAVIKLKDNKTIEAILQKYYLLDIR